jgi:hypothetical protein
MSLTARANETTNATAVTTEQTRALAAESAIITTIDGLNTSVAAAIAALDTEVTNNYNTQQSDDAAVNTALTSLLTNTAANLLTETNARIAAGATLTADVATNATAIADEETRATAAETGLQSQITNLLSNTDGTALNSLAELVADYNAGAATALNAQIATYDAKMITIDAQTATLQQEVYDLTNPP